MESLTTKLTLTLSKTLLITRIVRQYAPHLFSSLRCTPSAEQWPGSFDGKKGLKDEGHAVLKI